MEKNKKPSYEELEKMTIELSERCKSYNSYINTVSMIATRIEMLFRVLEFASHFNPEFVDKCASEIESLLTVDNKEE